MTRNKSVGLVASAVITLSACGTDSEPSPSPGEQPSPLSASASAADEPGSTRVLARLVGRSGRWQATVGAVSDHGDLSIRFRCTGGGNISVASSHGGEAVNACDGGTKLFNESTEVPSGAVTVTVEPDGEQQWSLLVARGPVTSGSEWPADAPEIQPSS